MSTINDYDYQKDESLSDTWKYRFAFFLKRMVTPDSGVLLRRGNKRLSR